MQAAGFVVRRWMTRWRRLWPTGRNADDFKRDSKLAFYSVLWKQHVYSLHCPGWGCWRSIADGAGQLHGGKGWAVGTTGQVHATEAKNHFATWSQKWRQWSWTPCEAQTAGNFGMPPAKPNHLCCWPYKIEACLAFLAQLCLGFHLIFAKEHI